MEDGVSGLEQLDISAGHVSGLAACSLLARRYHWTALRRFFGATPIVQISSQMISRYVGSRREMNVRGQTIRRELHALRRGLGVAKRDGLLAAVPEFPVVRRSTMHPTRRGRLIPRESLVRFLGRLPEEVRDEFVLVLLTGLRRSELCRLRAEWIEATDESSPTPALLRIPDYATKTRKERCVGLPEEALEILDRRIRWARTTGVALFRMSDRRTAIAEAARHSALSFVPHHRDLRHTHASLAAAALGDVQAVQAALGHSDLKTTALYLSSTTSRTLSVAQSVADEIFGEKNSDPVSGAADAALSTSARDWTRTSKVLPTGTSSQRDRLTQAAEALGQQKTGRITYSSETRVADSRPMHRRGTRRRLPGREGQR